MRSVLVSAVALAIASSAATVVRAADASPPVQVDPSDAVERLLAQYDADIGAQRYESALAAVQAIPVDSLNNEGRAWIASMKAIAFLGLKREKDAGKAIAEARHLARTEPWAANTLFLGALHVQRMDVAADAFDEMIDRFPDVARRQDPEVVSFFLRQEPKGQERRNEDRRIALARIGYGGDSPSADYLAARAIRILLKRGDITKASDLLRYVDEPQIIENMLIQRRFAPFWPALEKMAGKQLATVRASSAAAAERAYEETPDDQEKLSIYINALRHAGRLSDAIALRSRLPGTSEAMSRADEQVGWSVNNVALALNDAGRSDEADQLFAMLNNAPMPKEYWRVSMKINRLELLVTNGQFEQALPLIESTAKTEGSPYADQLVRRLQYCTLSSLGRKDEAAKHLSDLLAHAKDAYSPTIDGLLCAGQVDQAEKVALEALGSDQTEYREQFEEDFVRGLQPVLLISDDPSVWQGRWSELRKRPPIAAAYERLGRDMPSEFLVSKESAVAK